MKTKISTFQSIKHEPKTITLRQWLDVCKHGSRNPKYTENVLEYRRALFARIQQGFTIEQAKDQLKESGEHRLKTGLPLATVGALCENGRRIENVIQRTGWIALDIDFADNQHLTDSEQLRNEIAKIANVAYAGISTSGLGVWALVKVEHPTKQAEHFKALKADFETHFGIKLDASKGKNPNDARFYSYDPGAIIKESFTVYTKLLTPKPKPQRRSLQHTNFGDHSNYVKTAFKKELEILSLSLHGGRNNQLFKSSASLAGFVASGLLTEPEVQQALFGTAEHLGLSEHEIKTTIRSGFDAGLKSPRSIPEKTSIKRNYTPPPKRSTTIIPPANAKTLQNLTSDRFPIEQPIPYPAEWDTIKPPEAGTDEYIEMIRAVIADSDTKQPDLVTELDNRITDIMNVFDAQPV